MLTKNVNKIIPKLKCHQNLKVTKTNILPTLKCHQNYNITNTKLYNRTFIFKSFALYPWPCLHFFILTNIKPKNTLKYPAYWRHWLSWYMQKLAPIQLTSIKSLKKIMCHVSCVMCHMTHVACCMSHLTFHLSCVTHHISLPSSAIPTDPPPANFPNRHSRAVCEDPESHFFYAENHKNITWRTSWRQCNSWWFWKQTKRMQCSRNWG